MSLRAKDAVNGKSAGSRVAFGLAIWVCPSLLLAQPSGSPAGPWLPPQWPEILSSVTLEPSAPGRARVMVGIHAHAQVAGRSLCHNLARLSGGAFWLVCPWGTHTGAYAYRRFLSSGDAEKKILRGLARLREKHGARVQDEDSVLVGEDDGAVLATRIAGRRPRLFPRLVLVLRNKSALVSKAGARAWSPPQSLEAFARGGGRSVTYLIKYCRDDNQCPSTTRVCEPVTRLGLRCERLTLTEDVMLSSMEEREGQQVLSPELGRTFLGQLRAR